MKLCSACLLGVKCRYDGKSNANQKVLDLLKKDILIPVCPEQLAGLPIPRGPFEIKGQQVFSQQGADVTQQFIQGAQETLRIARIYNIQEAVFKQRSPSCGSGQVYDGQFNRTVVKGDGMTTRLLKEHGIKVITEEDI